MKWLSTLPLTANDKIAVIDIGSNSVRMVVYDGLKRMPMPLFNEKRLCGLARDLEKTGKLHAEGRKLAEHSIARYVRLIRTMKVEHIIVLATSAVRDADDGQEFAAGLERTHKIKVTILTGEEEAKYAGLGILSSFYKADGVSGDLGGGSLELTPVSKGKLQSGVSFPIGPLRLMGGPKDQKNSKLIIDSYLKAHPLLKKMEDKTFYAVGGGFRTLAKLFMDKKKYPVKILHDYRIPAKEWRELLGRVAETSPAKLAQIHPEAGKRAETLSLTAQVGERILAYGKPKDVIFSVYGIREGFLYGMLPSTIQKEDPLIAACADIIRHLSPDNTDTWSHYGHDLFNWMQPLFPKESPEFARLRLAACILLRLAWYEHTEYRGEIAFRWVLDAQFVALNHSERMFLALCIFHRYHSGEHKEIYRNALTLLDRKTIHKARIIGLSMRLGYNISGGGAGVLNVTTISIKQQKLQLEILKTSFAALYGDAVQKRFHKLANALQLKPVVV
jgi:exopolyphosphatase/guanosine-5'-triphosphate,3'-diphosphate pyrophosphatase